MVGQSITIWGALITALSTVLPALGPVIGIDVTSDLVHELGDQIVHDGAGDRRTRRHGADNLRTHARNAARSSDAKSR